MSRSKHRFGEDSRRRANLITLAVVMMILGVGVWLLVRAVDYADNRPRSAVN